MRIIYRIYQLLVAIPLAAVSTVIAALAVSVGCSLGNGHFWGYYPGCCWAWLMTRLFLLPVTVEGREHLEPGQSYVFVANHQGAFDIFLIYGFLHRNFKWMMKRELRNMPFVGYACYKAHHIFVDRRGPSKVKETYEEARDVLKSGMSLVVFPEGARTFTGHMGDFKKGAFMLADELQLPVVPLTINGSFNVMPRMRDCKWVTWHPLSLTIHQAIYPVGKGQQNVRATMHQAYDSVMSSLVPEYQGRQDRPDM